MSLLFYFFSSLPRGDQSLLILTDPGLQLRRVFSHRERQRAVRQYGRVGKKRRENIIPAEISREKQTVIISNYLSSYPVEVSLR